jgi:hypothetical protein
MYQLIYHATEDKSHKEESFETAEAALDRACELLAHKKIVLHDNGWTIQAYVFEGSLKGDDFLIPVAGSNEIAEYYCKKHAPTNGEAGQRVVIVTQ